MRAAAAALLALFAFAPAAAAQDEPPLAEAPPEQPAAGPGRTTLSSGTGLVDRGRRYVMKGQRVVVSGRLTDFSSGDEAVVEVFRNGVAGQVARVRPRDGEFSFSFLARRVGRYTVKARDAAGGRAEKAELTVRSVYPQAGSGATGQRVRLLQRGLRDLGFATPAPRGKGRFDGATWRAVVAFRKTNRMARTGFASRAVYRKLFARRGAFEVRYPRAGKHVEVDWSRQVMALVRGSRVERVYHVSTGTSATPTVFGTFRFYRKSPGTNASGMVHSSYFIRGYAIHGYQSVPMHPASHGCVRVPIPSARSIFDWVKLGDRISVYR